MLMYFKKLKQTHESSRKTQIHYHISEPIKIESSLGWSFRIQLWQKAAAIFAYFLPNR